MSLYSALNAGVAGLGAQSSAMAAVADNISNINTVGYKATQTAFSTLVTEGRAGATYSAGGVVALPVSMISQQGLLQSSSSSTDLAIDGQGFFVTHTTPDPNSPVELTRAGSFKPDSEGYLRNPAGLYLFGWPLDSAGNHVNNGTFGSMQPVRLSDLTGTAQPTDSLKAHINLDSTTAVFGGTYAAGDLASGKTPPDFSRSMTVYDAQGGSHQITMGFLKTGTNQWSQEVYATPASDVTTANGLLSSGTVAFNADGSLNLANSSPSLFQPLSIPWSNGAASVPIKLSLGTNGGIDGLTQYATQSAMLSSTINGGMLGNVSSIDVSSSGQVSAIFDDGTTRAVFQLPLVTVQNPDALTRVSGNAYTVSKESGSPVIASPGTLGAGGISANMLEASTVDLAGEFTNMIRFQRAYSASSKIITTVDQMLQELSNLKQ